MKELLKIDDLYVKAGDKEILNGIDMKINKGEIHVIMGPNGSGKTTTANAIFNNPEYKKQIGVFEEEIKVLKQEIGEIVNMNRNSLFSVTMVNYQLAQIETKERAIAQLEQEIEELNERSKSAGIEEIIEEIAEKKLILDEINQDTPPTQTILCANCNEHYSEPKKFCEKCGYSMSVSE